MSAFYRKLAAAAAALAFLTCLAGSAAAKDPVYEGAGVSAGAFASNGVGARSRALGQSYVSVADDCNSVYWNPAGLTGVRNLQVDTMRSSLFMDDLYYNYFGAAKNFQKFTLGAGVIILSVDGIEKYSDGTYLGDMSGRESGLIFSIGIPAGGGVNIGASIKGLSQEYGDFRALGFGADVGLKINILKNINFGLAMQDIIGPRLQLVTGGNVSVVPLKIRAGFSAGLFDRITVSLEVHKQSGYDRFFIRSGAEYKVMDGLYLRGGVDDMKITAGAGIIVNIFSFDAAYVTGDLRDNYYFSMGLRL